MAVKFISKQSPETKPPQFEMVTIVIKDGAYFC